jgi:hypothetical protein
MYPIGNVKQNGLFALGGQVLRALKDFNFYVEYALFVNNTPDFTQESVKLWVETLGSLLERTEENVNEYHSLTDRQQQDVDFNFNGERMPTVAALEFVQKVFPNIADFIDPYQIATIASHLDMVLTLGSVHELLTALATQECPNPQIMTNALSELVIAINLPLMEEEQKRIIAEHGYAISPVCGEKANYAFTLSGDTAFGTELLCVQGKADPDLICSLMGCVIALIQEGKQVLEIDDTIATMKDGSVMRYLLIKADPILAIAELGELGSIKAGSPLVQLVVADINNLLPGEEGYDSVNFYQPVFELKEETAGEVQEEDIVESAESIVARAAAEAGKDV